MKKQITWGDLIKKTTSEQQSKGVFSGLKNVLGAAKKEWDIIKSGKHPLFSVGKGKSVRRNNTYKNNNKKNNYKTIKNKIQLCSKCKLCPDCMRRNGLN